ncbi:MAG: NADH-quinone oxidoreductase subunit NuoK [Armatimonadota bacterium]
MAQPSLNVFLTIGSLLFCIGVYGVLTRRNAVAVLMGVELILNAANINLVSFARFCDQTTLSGHSFAVFVMTIAAAEAAVGLAIVIALYRNFKHINVDDINFMRW